MKTERTALDVPDRKLVGERFPPELRLRRPSEFEQVFQRGKHASDSVLVIHAMRNDLPYSRLGLSVSRRVGGAVVRNRWKRSIREAWRTQRHDLPVGMDIVVRPRKGATLDYHAIRDSLRRLLARLDRLLARGTQS